MPPKRPYFIRAIYEWILDNGLTPYISVNTQSRSLVLPQQRLQNDNVVINISPQASKNLLITNKAIEFRARFGEKTCDVYLPMPAIMAIFAHETSDGMIFTPEDIENQISEILNHWQAFKKDKLSLQPFKQVYFDTEARDDMNHANVHMIYLLSCIALIILFMTIFNYANLTISRGFERMNEIGIKKASGAGKKAIF